MDKVLVCKQCAQERELQIKLEEERDVEDFVDYVEAYFQLTPSDEQKGLRELYEDFNKQTYNRQTTSHQDSLCMSIERAGLGQPSKCTNSSFSLLPLDLMGDPSLFSEETSWMGLRSDCDLPAQPSSCSDGAPLASSLVMMKDMSFFESTILVSLLPRSEADFPSSLSSIRMASLCPRAPLGAIVAVRQPFIPPCRFFLLQSFRVALDLDLLLCFFRGSCWCRLSLAPALVFLRCGTLLDTGLVIPVEVVRNKTEAERSREKRSSCPCNSGLSTRPLQACTTTGGLEAWSATMQRARQRSVSSAWVGSSCLTLLVEFY